MLPMLPEIRGAWCFGYQDFVCENHLQVWIYDVTDATRPYNSCNISNILFIYGISSVCCAFGLIRRPCRMVRAGNRKLLQDLPSTGTLILECCDRLCPRMCFPTKHAALVNRTICDLSFIIWQRTNFCVRYRWVVPVWLRGSIVQHVHDGQMIFHWAWSEKFWQCIVGR